MDVTYQGITSVECGTDVFFNTKVEEIEVYYGYNEPNFCGFPIDKETDIPTVDPSNPQSENNNNDDNNKPNDDNNDNKPNNDDDDHEKDDDDDEDDDEEFFDYVLIFFAIAVVVIIVIVVVIFVIRFVRSKRQKPQSIMTDDEQNYGVLMENDLNDDHLPSPQVVPPVQSDGQQNQMYQPPQNDDIPLF